MLIQSFILFRYLLSNFKSKIKEITLIFLLVNIIVSIMFMIKTEEYLVKNIRIRLS